MPLVVIARDPKRLGNIYLKLLTRMLPGLIADTLSCSNIGGLLIPSDIEVRVQDFSTHDVNTKDLEIIILTNWFPERERDLENSRYWIIKAIKTIIPEDLTGYVWILLQPGSFGKL